MNLFQSKLYHTRWYATVCVLGHESIDIEPILFLNPWFSLYWCELGNLNGLVYVLDDLLVFLKVCVQLILMFVIYCPYMFISVEEIEEIQASLGLALILPGQDILMFLDPF